MPSDDLVAFEHYRVLRREDGTIWELGRGAMGVTYKAIDDNLHKVVALKVINALHVEKESSRDRFLREARAAASLNHRNVAVVHHLGQNAQNFFYAMEFIDGETVDALVRRAGPRPWQDALEITVQVTRALAAAHEKRLVHRDIKPANIMLVAEAGEDYTVVKLIDFGLAKTLLEEGGSLVHTSASGFVGTPLYASPEQCNEEAPDIRSDIYSLGITLWFMLTGHPPFNGPLGKVFAQHLSAPPPWEQLPGDVPAPVRAVLARMLAKERPDRPQAPLELRRELETCLRDGGPPNPAPPDPLPVRPMPIEPREGKFRRNHQPVHAPASASPFAPTRRGWLTAALTVLVMTAAGLAALLFVARKPARPAASTVTPAPVPAVTPGATPTFTPTPEDTSAPTPATAPAFGPVIQRWIADARREADTITDYSPKAVALSGIAVAQARAGDTAGSRQNFAAALQTVRVVNGNSSKADILSGIAAAQARAGDTARSWENFMAAMQAARAVEGDSLKDSTLGNIAAAQARAGFVEAALQTAQAIGDDSYRASALCSIAVAQARAGDTASSQQNFTAALQIARDVKDDSQKDSDLSGIAASQARAGDVAAALQTVQAIKENYWKSEALRSIAAAQARAGDVAAALQSAQAIGDDFGKGYAMRCVAAAQARAGDVAAALQTAQAIKDDFWKGSALRGIATVQARAGNAADSRQSFAAALQIARALYNNSEKADALRNIAAAQARAGDVLAAEQTIDSLDPGKHRCAGYLAAANALLADPAQPEDD